MSRFAFGLTVVAVFGLPVFGQEPCCDECSTCSEAVPYFCESCGEDCCACDCCPGEAGGGGGSSWNIGFTFVFAKPYFGDNLAFTVTESDGASFENITDTDFEYDFLLSPRVWLGYQTPGGIGVRAGWWQFDQQSDVLQTSPPANGFGLVEHPVFGLVDISSTIPTDSFSAQSSLRLNVVDLEGTMGSNLGGWDLLVGGGVRYGIIEQRYQAFLRDGANTLVGSIDFQHQSEGAGPTISMQAQRPVFGSIGVFASGRGSWLFTNDEARLAAGEDLDLTTPFFTNRTTTRDGILPIYEGQAGVDWIAPNTRFGIILIRGAVEGQWWGGAGSASSEDGDLGFLGLNLQVGIVR